MNFFFIILIFYHGFALKLLHFLQSSFIADSLHYCEESSSPTYSAPPLPFSQQYITLLQGQLMCYLSVLVVGDKFVRDPVKFSNQSTTFEDAFNDFFPHAKKGLCLFTLL